MAQKSTLTTISPEGIKGYCTVNNARKFISDGRAFRRDDGVIVFRPRSEVAILRASRRPWSPKTSWPSTPPIIPRPEHEITLDSGMNFLTYPQRGSSRDPFPALSRSGAGLS